MSTPTLIRSCAVWCSTCWPDTSEEWQGLTRIPIQLATLPVSASSLTTVVLPADRDDGQFEQAVVVKLHHLAANTMPLFREICLVLEAAHGLLVVHRDHKPAHILVTAEGNLNVVDLAMATLLDDLKATRYSQPQLIPAYVCPERQSGQPQTATRSIVLQSFEAMSTTKIHISGSLGEFFTNNVQRG